MNEVFTDTHSRQAQVKTGEPSGLARRSWLEPLAGVYASGGAAITNKRSAGVFADRGDLMTDRLRAVYVDTARDTLKFQGTASKNH